MNGPAHQDLVENFGAQLCSKEAVKREDYRRLTRFEFLGEMLYTHLGRLVGATKSWDELRDQAA